MGNGANTAMYKGLLIATAVALTAANGTSAWAGWGCAFSGSDIKGNFGRTWNADTREEARTTALRLCKRDHKGCYIVACKENVDSKEDADALWPMKGPPLRTCGGPGEAKC